MKISRFERVLYLLFIIALFLGVIWTTAVIAGVTNFDALTTSGDVTVGGNMTVAGTQTVTGGVTFSGDITAPNITATTKVTAAYIYGTNGAEIGTTKKIYFNDEGTFINSPSDGKMQISADGTGVDDLKITGTLYCTDDATIAAAKKIYLGDTANAYINSPSSGKITVYGASTAQDAIKLQGKIYGTDDLNMAAAKKIYMGDTDTAYINSPSAGKLTMYGSASAQDALKLQGQVYVTDNLEMAAAKAIYLGDTDNVWFYSPLSGKAQLYAGAAGTDDITFNGTISALDNVMLDAAKAIIFRSSGIFISSGAAGKMTIAADGTGVDDVTVNGTIYMTDNATLATSKALYMGDTENAWIHSPSAGTVSIYAGAGGAASIVFATTTRFAANAAFEKKAYFSKDAGDTSAYITAESANGELGITANKLTLSALLYMPDNMILTSTKKIYMTDVEDVWVNSPSVGKMRFSASGTSTDDFTFDGTLTFLDNLLVNGTKQLFFTDANSYIQNNGTDVILMTDKNIVLEAIGYQRRYGTEDYTSVDETADGTIPDDAMAEIDSSGTLVVATVNSTTVIGLNKTGAQVVNTDPMDLGVSGMMIGIADQLVAGGSLLKCGTGGRGIQLVTAAMVNAIQQSTATAGGGFTNQPATDSVQCVSSAAGDTTQTVTIWGTRNALGDVVYTDTKTLTGVTPVDFTNADWALVLGVELSATCTGTITVQEKSGGLAITTIAPASTTSGILAISGAANQRSFNIAPVIYSDAGTTKQIGMVGTSVAYAAQLDSQAINGTNLITMNSAFNNVTRLLVGDLEAGRTIVFAVGAADTFDKCVGRAGPVGAASKDAALVIIKH